MSGSWPTGTRSCCGTRERSRRCSGGRSPIPPAGRFKRRSTSTSGRGTRTPSRTTCCPRPVIKSGSGTSVSTAPGSSCRGIASISPVSNRSLLRRWAALGGPADWALPYWNYSDAGNPKARSLRPEFFAPTIPGGGANPLLLQARKAGCNTGQLMATAADVSLRCLSEPDYSAQAPGGSTGFGGPKTGFQHSGSRIGQVEGTPHGTMHNAVGGLMGGFKHRRARSDFLAAPCEHRSALGGVAADQPAARRPDRRRLADRRAFSVSRRRGHGGRSHHLAIPEHPDVAAPLRLRRSSEPAGDSAVRQDRPNRRRTWRIRDGHSRDDWRQRPADRSHDRAGDPQRRGGDADRSRAANRGSGGEDVPQRREHHRHRGRAPATRCS